MWVSSGTAAVKAAGSPAARAAVSVDSTAPAMNCAVIGGGEGRGPGSRRAASMAATKRSWTSACLRSAGPPATWTSTSRPRATRGRSSAKAADLVEPRPQRLRASRPPLPRHRGPWPGAARSRPRGRRHSSRLCSRSGGRTGRGFRRSLRSRPGPRPAGIPSPRRSPASPRGSSAGFRRPGARGSRRTGSAPRAACRTSDPTPGRPYAARPPYAEDDSAFKTSCFYLDTAMSLLVRDPRPGYPSPVASLPDHLLPGAVGKEPISRDVLEQHQRRRVLDRRDRRLRPARLPVHHRRPDRLRGEDRRRKLLRPVRRQGGLLPLPLRPDRRRGGGADRGRGRRRGSLGGPGRRGARGRSSSWPPRSPTGPGSRSSRRPPRVRPRRRAMRRRSPGLRRACARAAPGTRAGEGPPAGFEHAAVAGLAWTLHQRLAVGEPLVVAELLPEMADFVVAPYAGTGMFAEVTASRYRPPGRNASPKRRIRRASSPSPRPPWPAARLRRPEPARPPRGRDHRRRLRVRLPRDDDHPDRGRGRRLAAHLLQLLQLEGRVLLRDLRPDRGPPPRRRPRRGRRSGRVAGSGRGEDRRRPRGLLDQPAARRLHARRAAARRRRGDRLLPARPRLRACRAHRRTPRRDRGAEAVACRAAIV